MLSKQVPGLWYLQGSNNPVMYFKVEIIEPIVFKVQISPEVDISPEYSQYKIGKKMVDCVYIQLK